MFPVRRVPKTSSPDDNVHPQVPFCHQKRSPAFNFVGNSSSLERGRPHGELVGAGSSALSFGDRCLGTACPRPLHRSRGTLSLSATRFLQTSLPRPTNSAAGMTRSDSVGRACTKACRVSFPLQVPVASLGRQRPWSPFPSADRPVPASLSSPVAGPEKRCPWLIGLP